MKLANKQQSVKIDRSSAGQQRQQQQTKQQVKQQQTTTQLSKKSSKKQEPITIKVSSNKVNLKHKEESIDNFKPSFASVCNNQTSSRRKCLDSQSSEGIKKTGPKAPVKPVTPVSRAKQSIPFRPCANGDHRVKATSEATTTVTKKLSPSVSNSSNSSKDSGNYDESLTDDCSLSSSGSSVSSSSSSSSSSLSASLDTNNLDSNEPLDVISDDYQLSSSSSSTHEEALPPSSFDDASTACVGGQQASKSGDTGLVTGEQYSDDEPPKDSAAQTNQDTQVQQDSNSANSANGAQSNHEATDGKADYCNTSHNQQFNGNSNYNHRHNQNPTNNNGGSSRFYSYNKSYHFNHVANSTWRHHHHHQNQQQQQPHRSNQHTIYYQPATAMRQQAAIIQYQQQHQQFAPMSMPMPMPFATYHHHHHHHQHPTTPTTATSVLHPLGAPFAHYNHSQYINNGSATILISTNNQEAGDTVKLLSDQQQIISSSAYSHHHHHHQLSQQQQHQQHLMNQQHIYQDNLLSGPVAVAIATQNHDATNSGKIADSSCCKQPQARRKIEKAEATVAQCNRSFIECGGHIYPPPPSATMIQLAPSHIHNPASNTQQYYKQAYNHCYTIAPGALPMEAAVPLHGPTHYITTTTSGGVPHHHHHQQTYHSLPVEHGTQFFTLAPATLIQSGPASSSACHMMHPTIYDSIHTQQHQAAIYHHQQQPLVPINGKCVNSNNNYEHYHHRHHHRKHHQLYPTASTVIMGDCDDDTDADYIECNDSTTDDSMSYLSDETYSLLQIVPVTVMRTRSKQPYGMSVVWQEEFELLFKHFTMAKWLLQEVETKPLMRPTSQTELNYLQGLNRKFKIFVDSAKVRFCCDNCGHGWTSMKGRVIFWYELFQVLPGESDDGLSSGNPPFAPERPNSTADDGNDGAEGATVDVIDMNTKEGDICIGQRKQQDLNCEKEKSNETELIETDNEVTNEVKDDEIEAINDVVVDSHNEDTKSENDDKNNWQQLGYCAFKLFGQQCDHCNQPNKFERAMWYPEEVGKVLNNFYNKIGQVYYGFKMPAIDKQRRAGKPKTSHNGALCQACHDGVCADRK